MDQLETLREQLDALRSFGHVRVDGDQLYGQIGVTLDQARTAVAQLDTERMAAAGRADALALDVDRLTRERDQLRTERDELRAQLDTATAPAPAAA